ncbi:MAG TPA: GDSL-type esterase/lipase family protein [Stellaceae bacterium]|nr:GDSL-type esterase/lipase family protein [Stellaceae bacterium]
MPRRALLASALAGGTLPLAGCGEPPENVRLREDWAFLARYRDDNALLVASGRAVDCVFMGDSITEGWLAKRPGFFTPGLVCRGIGGQTTPQMLVRFRADVVQLKPVSVHIMAGTNDIAGNTGPMTEAETKANLMSMAELAQTSGLRVVLASIPPAARFPWRPGLETVKPIRAINAWLRSSAAEIGAIFADYHAVLADENGGMRPGYAVDEVHPTEAGYAAMEPVARAAIAQAAMVPRRHICEQ